MVRNQRPAYTLLEIILALALATVILGLMAMAVQVNLKVSDNSRKQVEEAQLARALLQRIADDLRNAVPYQPAQGASDDSSGSAGATPTSSSSQASGSVAASGSGDSSSSSSTTSSTAPSGGIFGTNQGVQIETTRRPRMTRALMAATQDGTQTAMLSDLRVVSYTLGLPDGSSAPATSSSDSLTGPGGSEDGLYRCDMDRSEYYWASQQGQTDEMDQSTERLASEVVGVTFTYYDGTTPNDTWDSSEEGKLPSAVRVAISIRRPQPKTLQTASALPEDNPLAVYDMLVDLPNSAVTQGQSGSDSSDSTDSSDSSTAPDSTNPVNPVNPVDPAAGKGKGKTGGEENGKGEGKGKGKGKGGRGKGRGRGQGGQGGEGQGGRGRGGQGQGQGQGKGRGQGRGQGQGQGPGEGRGQGQGQGQGQGEGRGQGQGSGQGNGQGQGRGQGFGNGQGQGQGGNGAAPGGFGGRGGGGAGK